MVAEGVAERLVKLPQEWFGIQHGTWVADASTAAASVLEPTRASRGSGTGSHRSRAGDKGAAYACPVESPWPPSRRNVACSNHRQEIGPIQLEVAMALERPGMVDIFHPALVGEVAGFVDVLFSEETTRKDNRAVGETLLQTPSSIGCGRSSATSIFPIVSTAWLPGSRTGRS